MRRNISFGVMIIILFIILGVGGYLVYDLTKMYYDTYEYKNNSILVEKNGVYFWLNIKLILLILIRIKILYLFSYKQIFLLKVSF